MSLAGPNMAAIRQQRRQRNGRRGRVVIDEPNGRRILRQGRRARIRGNEVRRLRRGARNVSVRRRGGRRITTITKRNGARIVTYWDRRGRLLRRIRWGRNGRKRVLINNILYVGYGGHHHDYYYHDFPVYIPVDVPIPYDDHEYDDYYVDAAYAEPDEIYSTFVAPPIRPLGQFYTLDQIRDNYPLRAHMRSVVLTKINFDTGSWYIDDYGLEQLSAVADAMQRVLSEKPDEIFLVEGHTDAVGDEVDNLSLSDRRAEAVAIALTEQFGIPQENLTTQGYGEEHLYIKTQGPERRNRRVVVRRITPLLSQTGDVELSDVEEEPYPR